MRKSRGLNMKSSALFLLVVLGAAAGSAKTCEVSLVSVASGAALCLDDVASGGNFSAADIVGLLVSSAANGSHDLRSLPALARNSRQACKTGLPNVLSRTLGLPSHSPWLAAVDSLCDGLTARFQNASTPEQFVLAASTMVKDAMAAVSTAASVEQVAQALAQIAFGADAAGNLTAVATMNYQAIAVALAAFAKGSTSGSFNLIKMIKKAIAVDVGNQPFRPTCVRAFLADRIVLFTAAALASPTANSSDLVASQLVRLINNEFDPELPLINGQFCGNPALDIYDVINIYDALVPHGCNITDYDSIVACLLSDNAAAGGGSPLAAAADRLRDAFAYALLTGLQNSTRALIDLARLTGVSAFLNSI